MIDNVTREAFRAMLRRWSRLRMLTDPKRTTRERVLEFMPRRLSQVYTLSAEELGPDLEKFGYDVQERSLIYAVLGSWDMDEDVDSEVWAFASPLAGGFGAEVGERDPGLDPWQLDGRAVYDEVLRLGILALLRTQTQLRWLYNSAQNGLEESILSLAEIDKGAIGEGEMAIHIQRRHLSGDWRFLGQLGRRLSRRLELKDLKIKEVEVLVAMFWSAGLKRLTWEQLRDFLADEGLLEWDADPLELAKRLRKNGLYKQEPAEEL